MNTKSLQSILLAAALIMMAGLLPSGKAYAAGSRCCCAADTCRCCCSQNDAPVRNIALQAPETASSPDCSCSSGPNPYGSDAAAAACINQYSTKKPLNAGDCTACSHCLFISTAPAHVSRPPPRLTQYRFLLNCSLLI